MDKVKVINRSGSTIGYRLPEINLSRTFAAGESKEIPKEELQKLAYQAGGQELIDAYLLICDEDLAEEISPWVSQEPEYNLTEESVKNLLLHGTIDEYLDVLDFAPDGVIELIKTLSISLPCTDTAKLNELKSRYGLDALHIIELNKSEENSDVDNTRERRVAPQNTGRRTSAETIENKYKVVSRT